MSCDADFDLYKSVVSPAHYLSILISIMTEGVPEPSKNVDWKNLTFKANEVNGHVQCTYKDGSWGALEFVREPFLDYQSCHLL